MMFSGLYSIGSSTLSSVRNAMAAKYYVSQQLSQMQAHNLNRGTIIEKANTVSKKVIRNIFELYDEAIQSDKYAWIKQENQLVLITLTDGKTRSRGGGKITACDENFHRGIFPPMDGIEATLEDCKTNIGEELGYKDWATQFSSFIASYVSNLEYWILTLEALEQDMALL
jgi:hypothetical protein